MKIGRNAPCPCGSGKKYKKCCLAKDEAERRLTASSPVDSFEERAPIWDDDEAEVWSGSSEDDGAEAELDFERPVSSEWGEEEHDESGTCVAFDPPLPPLSDEEYKVVDDWYDSVMASYKNCDADEMIRQMLEFLEARPDLFDHLALHKEFLFELGAELGRRNQHGRYVELLIRLRREQPVMYRRSFGYYDRDVIAELVVQNRRNEIPEYFGYFVEAPAGYPEQLEQIIELLAWRGWETELFALVTATAAKLNSSRDVIGGHFAARWMALRAYQPYIVASDCPPDAADRLFQEFRSWDERIRPDITRQQIAENLRTARRNPSDETFTAEFVRKRERYWILHGAYMRYLQNERGLPWVTARYLSDRIVSFWFAYREYGLAGDPLFAGEKDIETCLAKACRDFFSMNGVRLISTLQALALYGAWLRSRMIFSDEEEKIWSSRIAALYEKGRNAVEATDCAYRINPEYESLLFEEGNS